MYIMCQNVSIGCFRNTFSFSSVTTMMDEYIGTPSLQPGTLSSEQVGDSSTIIQQLAGPSLGLSDLRSVALFSTNNNIPG